jgi:hypothetical protein
MKFPRFRLHLFSLIANRESSPAAFYLYLLRQSVILLAVMMQHCYVETMPPKMPFRAVRLGRGAASAFAEASADKCCAPTTTWHPEADSCIRAKQRRKIRARGEKNAAENAY